MAIVKTPLLSFDASGQIGRGAVHGRRGRQHVARDYARTPRRNTPAVQAWSSFMRALVADAKALFEDDQVRLAWNRRAQELGGHMSGYNLFVKTMIRINKQAGAV